MMTRSSKRKLHNSEIIVSSNSSSSSGSSQNIEAAVRKWTKLISSDWFAIFLDCLNLKEMVQLDSAFTNHRNRSSWLFIIEELSSKFKID